MKAITRATKYATAYAEGRKSGEGSLQSCWRLLSKRDRKAARRLVAEGMTVRLAIQRAYIWREGR